MFWTRTLLTAHYTPAFVTTYHRCTHLDTATSLFLAYEIRGHSFSAYTVTINDTSSSVRVRTCMLRYRLPALVWLMSRSLWSQILCQACTSCTRASRCDVQSLHINENIKMIIILSLNLMSYEIRKRYTFFRDTIKFDIRKYQTFLDACKIRTNIQFWCRWVQNRSNLYYWCNKSINNWKHKFPFPCLKYWTI